MSCMNARVGCNAFVLSDFCNFSFGTLVKLSLSCTIGKTMSLPTQLCFEHAGMLASALSCTLQTATTTAIVRTSRIAVFALNVVYKPTATGRRQAVLQQLEQH